VLILFFAGSKTINSTISNFILTMLHEPDMLARLRAEIDPFMATMDDDIMGKMTSDAVK